MITLHSGKLGQDGAHDLVAVEYLISPSAEEANSRVLRRALDCCVRRSEFWGNGMIAKQ
jgi:hypothetical protein